MAGGRPLILQHFRKAVHATLCAAAIALLVVPGNDASAQGLGTLTGVVTTEDASPLRLARVSISGTTLIVLTEADGSFRLAGVPAGVQTIEVKLLGYSPLALPVDVLGGESMNVKLLLSAQPVTLNPVEVRGDSSKTTPPMKGFLDRKARGAGTFFDQKEIVEMQPRQVTDVLRRVAGLRIESFGTGSVVQMGRNSGGMGNRLCPVVFYLNGSPFPLAEHGSINNYLAPEELVGVEVYNGASQVPQQFNSGMYNTRCGVIAIWTRSGPESRPPRRGSAERLKPKG
jgi:hypothetical protein